MGARSANEVTAGAEWLFADVGGTNVRVCRWRAGAGVGTTRRAPADAYTGLGEALAGLDDDRAAPPDRAAIAIALQVRGARLRMTNRDWVFDAKALRAALGLDELRVVNDFAAAAAGLPALDERDAATVREGSPGSGNLLLIGPGTGLGTAALLGAGSGDERVVASEAGHMSLAFHDAALEPLHALARPRWGRLSWERLLCGEGLGWLHAWQAGAASPTPAREVSARAARGEATARGAVRWFSRLLGACAGDLCLAFGADGGVWLAGGVLDGLGDAFDADAFLEAFDDKGRYAARQRTVPVRRVLAGDLAFRGLARIVDGACRAPGLRVRESGIESRQ